MRRLGGVLAGVLLTASLAVSAVPAQAASTYITIYNSSLSFTVIEVKPNGGRLNPGQHTSSLYNGDNRVRVDTDYTGVSHSYKINPVGAPVGPCHTNSDNHNSDPPNYAEVYYQNFDHGNCTN